MANKFYQYNKIVMEEREKTLSYVLDQYCYSSDSSANVYYSDRYYVPFKYYNGCILEMKFVGWILAGEDYWKVRIKDKKNNVINTIYNSDYNDAFIKAIEFINLVNMIKLANNKA